MSSNDSDPGHEHGSIGELIRRRSSPAMVVALIALAFATVGTAAATSVIVNDGAQSAKKAKKGPRGPAGPKGPAGANGTNGTDGTARAYARIDNPCATSSTCVIDHAKGISGARHTSTGGLYCITAPGIAPSTTTHVAAVDSGDTGANVGEAQAMPNSNGAACNSGEFEVQTTRGGAGNATNVAFYIMIP
jgi:hypothetical protein